MSDKVVLVFNDEDELTVSREAVSKSCFYLACLLEGSFKEANQTKVRINLDDVSFEAFKSVIGYAETGYFNTTLKNVDLYIEMAQIAGFWLYDQLVEIIESFLIDRVNLETVQDLHNSALILNLNRLLDECIKYEALLDKGITLPSPWGRCPKDDHQKHSYRVCLSNGYDQKHSEYSGWGDEPDFSNQTEQVDDDDLWFERELELFAHHRMNTFYKNYRC